MHRQWEYDILTLWKSFSVSLKIKYRLSRGPVILVSGIGKRMSPQMFTAALCVMAETGNNPNVHQQVSG